jgi:hypothetical protein
MESWLGGAMVSRGGLMFEEVIGGCGIAEELLVDVLTNSRLGFSGTSQYSSYMYAYKILATTSQMEQFQGNVLWR